MKTPTLTVLSLTTGVLLDPAGFSRVHEFAEALAGEPVFTHQFANAEFNTELREAVFQQHPALREVDVSGVNEGNWESFSMLLIERFGQYLSIQPMTRQPAASSEAFAGPLRSRQVIVVLAES